jgi:glycosyltransferase involved in cell wall biosynthesis
VNEAATIAAAILPLLSDPADVDLEVIVADGRSTDRTRDVVLELAARDPRVRLIDNPARVTPDALNAAILASRGDVIVRMDGHAEPKPGYLSACLAVLRAGSAWDVGGAMVKTGDTRAGRAASAATTSAFGIGGGLRHHLVTEPVDITSVWLGCWPRWVFERVGLFDTELVRNQDEELNRRILEAGGTIRFDPSIRATYRSRASWKSLFLQYLKYGMYRVRGVQKHPRMLRSRHLMPPALLAVIVVTALVALAAPLAGLITLVAIAAWVAGAVYFARGVARSYDSTVPDVVAAYACIHLGYGIGMWTGLVRFAPRWFINRRGAAPRLPPRPG